MEGAQLLLVIVAAIAVTPVANRRGLQPPWLRTVLEQPDYEQAATASRIAAHRLRRQGSTSAVPQAPAALWARRPASTTDRMPWPD